MRAKLLPRVCSFGRAIALSANINSRETETRSIVTLFYNTLSVCVCVLLFVDAAAAAVRYAQQQIDAELTGAHIQTELDDICRWL